MRGVQKFTHVPVGKSIAVRHIYCLSWWHLDLCEQR